MGGVCLSNVSTILDGIGWFVFSLRLKKLRGLFCDVSNGCLDDVSVLNVRQPGVLG